jgi:hypothetical protein
MEQAISTSTPSRRALLSRSAVLTAAGALAACVPTLAPAAEPGANRELARLCAQALACRDAAEVPLRSPANQRLAARTILALGYTGEDGGIDPDSYLGELAPLTSALITSIAAGARA